MQRVARGAAAMAAALPLAACGLSDGYYDPPKLAVPIAAPSLRPFADGRNFMLERPLVFQFGEASITVPRGFVTDLASIPDSIQSVRSALGTYNRAAIIHDYLYWTGMCTRPQADMIMFRAMIAGGTPPRVAWQIYLGVRGGGKKPFDQNRAERSGGAFRFVTTTPQDQYPRIDSCDWTRLRGITRDDRRYRPAPQCDPIAHELEDGGERLPPSGERPGYCEAIGSTAWVPTWLRRIADRP